MFGPDDDAAPGDARTIETWYGDSLVYHRTERMHEFMQSSSVAAEILTDGRQIHRYVSLLDTLVDEARFVFDQNGVSVSVVDPANVCMFDSVRLHAGGLRGYAYHEGVPVEVGVDLGRLKTALKTARRGQSSKDAVEIGVEPSGEILVNTTRTYDVDGLTDTPEMVMPTTVSFDTQTPKSMRQEPNVPDFEPALEYATDVSVDAMDDLADIFTGSEFNHLELQTSGDRATLTILGSDRGGGEALLGGVRALGDAPDDVTSIYSYDYFDDIFTGLRAANVSTATLQWGDEYPLRVQFEGTTTSESTVGVPLITGEAALAPRIQSEASDY